MRKFTGTLFAVLAALAIFVSALILETLPRSIADYGREPEDVWLGGFWLCLTTILAVYWTTGALRAFRRFPEPQGWLARAGTFVAVGLGILLLTGGILSEFDGDWLIILGILVLVSTGAFHWLTRLDTRDA